MAILQTTPILTLDYWKLAADITVGDIVFDRHGKPVRVKVVQNYRAPRCFEVTFNDHLTIAGDDHLILPIETPKYRTRTYTYKGKYKFRRPLKHIKLSSLQELPLLDKRGDKMYSVPTAGALEFPEQILPVPPFVFGLWFFNRTPGGYMTAAPFQYDWVKEKFRDSGYKVLETKKSTRFETKPNVLDHLKPMVPTTIPNNYLLSSVDQRLELLSGILHSRARTYNQKSDRFRFTSMFLHEVTQVQFLAESLGCKTSLEHRPQLGNYTLWIKTKYKLMEQQQPKPVKVRQNWRYVAKIQQIAPQSCVHIETDGEDGSILVGEGFIACH